MSRVIQSFTTRQYMVTPDFEYFHYRDRSTMEVDFHNHEFYEIYVLLSGKVTYMIEGRSYKLRPWDIILVNNRELHRPVISTGEAYERLVIWVNPQFVSARSLEGSNLSMCFETASHSRARLLRPAPGLLEDIKNALSRFEKACSGGSFGSNVLKITCLTELLVYLNAAFLEAAVSDFDADIEYDEKISRMIQYINANLTGDLSLDSLSERFYTSKYHLLREFKRHSGYTLHRYILQKRLLLARSLLRDGASASEACAKSGFRDYSNFIRSFRQAFGVPPGKYQK